MTCIVGLKADDGVWIGADRAVTTGGRVDQLAAPKISRLDDTMIVGFTGTLRGAQVIQYGFRVPRRHPKDELLEWMVTSVIPAWNERFRDCSVSTSNTVALAGVEGRLFTVAGDSAVCELVGDFHATGSGEEYALGAMHATAGTGMAPRERIMLALESAAAYCASVGGPFDVEFIGKAGEREPVTKKGKAA